jgi:hypothetical protein
MERQMSHALLPSLASKILLAASLGAAMLLTGCGPDHPPGAAASSAPSASAALAGADASRASKATPSILAESAASAGAALAAAPTAACPKQPACPVPAPSAAAPNPLAKAMGEKSRRLWAHHRGRAYAGLGRGAHHHRHFRGETQEAMLPPPPPLPPVERFAGGYRMREETRDELRTRAWRSDDGGRVIVRRGGCPGACPGGRRDWDYAGIDARGYLVWPGKVEY